MVLNHKSQGVNTPIIWEKLHEVVTTSVRTTEQEGSKRGGQSGRKLKTWESKRKEAETVVEPITGFSNYV